jgi:hypothetical protein
MVEGTEAVKKAKEFLDKVKPALTINRIPKKTLEAFRELAKEEFCEDYGFTLKWLMDFYLGAIGKGHERAEALALQALEETAELKTLSEGKEKKTIKNVAGQEMKVKENE